MMELSPVISKTIVAVGYNPFSMILRIQLKNGLYDFFNVPEKHLHRFTKRTLKNELSQYLY